MVWKTRASSAVCCWSAPPWWRPGGCCSWGELEDVAGERTRAQGRSPGLCASCGGRCGSDPAAGERTRIAWQRFGPALQLYCAGATAASVRCVDGAGTALGRGLGRCRSGVGPASSTRQLSHSGLCVRAAVSTDARRRSTRGPAVAPHIRLTAVQRATASLDIEAPPLPPPPKGGGASEHSARHPTVCGPPSGHAPFR